MVPRWPFLAIFWVLHFQREDEEEETGRKYTVLCPHPTMQGGHKQNWNHFLLTVKGTVVKQQILEMWANAQRDGRPAEHRWRPLFNAAKFG